MPEIPGVPVFKLLGNLQRVFMASAVASHSCTTYFPGIEMCATRDDAQWTGRW